jgi:hypothetical protein
MKSNSVAVTSHEYARDSFSIHTEERANGWGFRIRSDRFFMIYCMGGFPGEDIALIHASEYLDFLSANLATGGMNKKGAPESAPALPAPKRKRVRATA